MRTSLSICARGSTIAEGWIASLIARRLRPEWPPPERLHRALQCAHAPQQLGQPRFRRKDPLGLEARARGGAEIAPAGVEIVRHAHLPRQDDAASEPRAARDADLRDQDGVLAHLDVVAELHEIVDLGTAPDDRIAERRAVDRAVGADLDVVLDDDAARLGNLAMPRAVEGEAEP